MLKQFLTFTDQLALMENRGLIIDVPHNEALSFLSKVSYFHLNQYRFILEKATDVYTEDALFSSLCNIYKQDANLRSSIFTLIAEMEIAFRTQLAYYIGESCDSFSLALDSFTFNNVVVQEIWQRIFKESTAQHLVYAKAMGKNANEIEPWVALEGYNFASLLHLYNFLPVKFQNSVASFFKLIRADLSNALYAMQNLQNICGHHEAIICRYSFAKTEDIPSMPLPQDYITLKQKKFKGIGEIFPDLYPSHRGLHAPIKELFLPYYKILQYFIKTLNLDSTNFNKLTQRHAVILGLTREWL